MIPWLRLLSPSTSDSDIAIQKQKNLLVLNNNFCLNNEKKTVILTLFKSHSVPAILQICTLNRENPLDLIREQIQAFFQSRS